MTKGSLPSVLDWPARMKTLAGFSAAAAFRPIPQSNSKRRIMEMVRKTDWRWN
jgi:hypothetical protein